MAADPAVGRADVQPLRSGSPEAQAAQLMFERHGARVLAYCRRRLNSPEEAEDALQTTFLYACRGLGRGVVPVTEVAWLLKIAHNVCLSHWDSDRRRRRLELVRDPERLEASAPAAAGSRHELHALETALADLTELQRKAIVLREWRGLSYDEVAAELDLSKSAVEALIFRARRALAGSLEEQEVGRSTRTRVARALDFGGLLAGLKSLLGGGAAAKVAATGLAVGVVMLAPGSVPERAGGEPPAAEPTPAARPASVPAVVDPAIAPSMRAPATKLERRAPAKAKPRAAKRSERRSRRAPAQPDQPAAQAPTLGGTVGQVTTGAGDTLNGTVTAVTGTVGGVVETATGTVEKTVDTVPKIVDPTLDVVEGVLDEDDGLLGKNGPLLGGNP